MHQGVKPSLKIKEQDMNSQFNKRDIKIDFENMKRLSNSVVFKELQSKQDAISDKI